MPQYIQQLLDLLRSTLYPPTCINCGIQSEWLCKKCQNYLIPTLPECYLCKMLSPNYKCHTACRADAIQLNRVVTLWRYNEIARAILHRFKYKSAYLISNLIAHLANEQLGSLSQLFTSTETLVVPIPLHFSRFNMRGFNQSALISEAIALKHSAISVDLLRRTKKTRTQARSQYETRHKNLEGAFSIDPIHIRRLRDTTRILLVDDVLTTGSTIEAAAEELHRVAPHVEINAICLFRAGRRYSAR